MASCGRIFVQNNTAFAGVIFVPCDKTTAVLVYDNAGVFAAEHVEQGPRLVDVKCNTYARLLYGARMKAVFVVNL